MAGKHKGDGFYQGYDLYEVYDMADILLVEDNEEIGNLLADFLIAEGFDTYHARSGEEALELYNDEGAKVVILDIMLPGVDGFYVCTELRKHGNVPIIIVSAKSEKEDKLNGLILGADDYIEKPYDIDIVIAKIRGIIKRRYATDEIIDGNIRLDKISGKLYVNGALINATLKEIMLLQYMMENKGKVISKDELFNYVWGFGSTSEAQTLTVHIKWLRQKIEKDPKNPERIQTVWGVGYRFE